MNERLLASWVDAILNIRNNRFLDELSLNEMIVIRALNDYPFVTASQLCNQTGLLKSQMNHILEAMEKKGLITRDRHGDDKRKIQIMLTENGKQKYDHEHQRIGVIVDKLEESLGKEKADQLSCLLEQAVQVIRKEITND